MVLQDLFDTLASGEFSNLSLGQSVTGSIKEDAYPKVVSALNRSLLALYQRFLLKKKKVYLVQQSEVIQYYLRTSYLGTSDSLGSSAYLISHPNEEFTGDVIQVLGITDNEGLPVDINPPHPFLEQTYFKSTQFDTLNLVTPLVGETYLIEYQARIPAIEITETFDPETVELPYPPFIEEAMLYHVASALVRGRSSKASEGEGYASNTWAARYERACQELASLGLTEELNGNEDLRFERKGFV